MQGDLQNGIQCAEFEAWMTDALDGVLNGTSRMRFEAHRKSCVTCEAMFMEAESGLQWLHNLPEMEPPANLMNRIVMATSGAAQADTAQRVAAQSWGLRAREFVLQSLRPIYASVVQPRFAMSFGMAFFSISMLLNITGFKMGSLRHVDLRPSAVVRTYYETTGRLEKYYENIRFVYEIETRVRELKRATTPEDEKPTQDRNRKENKSEEPGKQYQNFSWDDSQHQIASSNIRFDHAIGTRRLS